MCLETLFIKFSTCLFHFASSLNVIPKCDLHELGDWSKRWLMSFNPDKTEIMLFKNVESSTNFYFYFDEKLIPLTSDHLM
jgi:hypothetical protein